MIEKYITIIHDIPLVIIHPFLGTSIDGNHRSRPRQVPGTDTLPAAVTRISSSAFWTSSCSKKRPGRVMARELTKLWKNYGKPWENLWNMEKLWKTWYQ